MRASIISLDTFNIDPCVSDPFHTSLGLVVGCRLLGLGRSEATGGRHYKYDGDDDDQLGLERNGTEGLGLEGEDRLGVVCVVFFLQISPTLCSFLV